MKGNITKTPDKSFLHYQNRPDNPHAVQLIFAGFPCQAFSNAGKKKRNDPRNTLFREFVRATRLIQPHIIIGETQPPIDYANVKILSDDHQDYSKIHLIAAVQKVIKCGLDLLNINAPKVM